MKDFKRFAAVPALAVLPWFVFKQDIHAYLDAGTGSLIIQAVIGGLVGGLVALRLFWNQIKAFFSKIFHRAKKTEDHEETRL